MAMQKITPVSPSRKRELLLAFQEGQRTANSEMLDEFFLQRVRHKMENPDVLLGDERRKVVDPDEGYTEEAMFAAVREGYHWSPSACYAWLAGYHMHYSEEADRGAAALGLV
jgi:hypothetical protein